MRVGGRLQTIVIKWSDNYANSPGITVVLNFPAAFLSSVQNNSHYTISHWLQIPVKSVNNLFQPGLTGFVRFGIKIKSGICTLYRMRHRL